jgi:hypothetical protein
MLALDQSFVGDALGGREMDDAGDAGEVLAAARGLGEF